jgi:hypothetical protein
MNEAITHFKVPVEREPREGCLGSDGSVAHVARVLRMITGRWKLPILFRLFAQPSMRAGSGNLHRVDKWNFCLTSA